MSAEYAHLQNIINGANETTFAPYAPASNFQMATLLQRCAEKQETEQAQETVPAEGEVITMTLLHQDALSGAFAFLNSNGVTAASVQAANDNPDAPGLKANLETWNNGLKPAKPTFKEAGGTPQVITISADVGAAIYYTVDGTAPTTGSTPYKDPISISETTTLKAIAVKNNLISDVASILVAATGKTLVTITGVTAVNGTYNGTAQAGYSGTPASAYTGDYDVSYTGRNGTDYEKSNTAPTNAGDYTVTFSGPANNEYYTGSFSLNFTITAPSKSAYVGGTVPVLSSSNCTVSGLVGNDVLETQPTVSYASTPDMSQSGTVAITASGAIVPNASNYDTNITYINGKLTVIQRSASSGSSGGGSSSSSSTTTKNPDGSTTTTITDKNGNVTEVKSTVSTAAAKEAGKTGAAVTLPVEVPAVETT